jgi:hypothetical protein
MTTTSTDIRKELAITQQELQFLRPPSLAPIQQSVQRLTTQALLHPERLDDLRQAQQRLDDAIAEHDRKNELEQTVKRLTLELQAAETNERLQLVDELKADYAEAVANYNTAGLALIRAYRTVLRARGRAGQQGVVLQLPGGFDFKQANPSMSSFSTSESMQQGMLYCERNDDDNA